MLLIHSRSSLPIAVGCPAASPPTDTQKVYADQAISVFGDQGKHAPWTSNKGIVEWVAYVRDRCQLAVTWQHPSRISEQFDSALGVTVIDPLLSLAHTVQSNKGVFALLLGSGISRSAGILTGWEVTLDLAHRLSTLTGEANPTDIADWYRAKFKTEPDYSALLDTLARSPAERRALLHGYFEPNEDEIEEGKKKPTPAHRAIAKLVAQGYIRVILTTNFDKLIETALRDENIEPVVINTPDAAEGAAPLVHQRCVVVKLHGDYLDERIKNTDAELAEYDSRINTYLDRVLDEFGLIVCGWSGEWDQALRAALERCKSRRYTTYWAAHRSPGLQAEALIKLRDAQLVNIRDADTFFTDLGEKVTSLDELKAPAPLSEEVAVASLKRYIAEPRHKIRLNDLIAGEVDRVQLSLANKMSSSAATFAPISSDEFLKRLRVCEASTAIMRSLFFHGARWAEPDHYEMFKNAMQMVVVRDNPGSSYVVWSNMQLYPSALLMYAGGYGCIVSGNYGLLKTLLDVQIDHRHETISASDKLLAVNVVDHNLAQEALYPPQRRYTPVSENIADLLTPLAERVTPDAAKQFDRLEVLLALNFIDKAELPPDPQWMPVGRFAWKDQNNNNSAANTLFAEYAEMGASWPPLRAGMFGGKLERVQRAEAAFRAVLSQIRWH